MLQCCTVLMLKYYTFYPDKMLKCFNFMLWQCDKGDLSDCWNTLSIKHPSQSQTFALTQL